MNILELSSRLERVSKKISELMAEARVLQMEVAEVRRDLETRQYVESK